MPNWKIENLTGSRENVSAEIKNLTDVPPPWRDAILAELAGFMPDWNGVRIDAHGHELQTKTPAHPVAVAEELKSAAKEKRDPKDISIVNGGILSVQISIKPIKLSGGTGK